MRRLALLLCAALSVARPAPAQEVAAAAPASALTAGEGAAVERAGRLVADGQGMAGRALIDTLVSLAPPGSGRYAELLFWRAAYAATAADAERDYRRLAVEFPLSPRAEDALVALAQLEMARGDRELALRHLERLTLEHPTGPGRVKAGYWAARIYFEMSDARQACAALQAAQAAAVALQPRPAEIETRINQELRKCPGVSGTAGAGPGAGRGVSTADVGYGPRPAPAPRDTAPAARPAPPQAPPAAVPAPAVPAAAAAPADSLTSRPPAAAPVAVPDTSAQIRRDSVVAGARPARVPAARPAATPPAAAAPSAPVYSVQIAAYDTPQDAESAARRVRGRGLDAHVDAEGGMFKVRVGRYRTRAEAAAALREVKGKGMKDAWVVTAGARQ